MPLNSAEEKKVRGFLASKTDNHVCQVCGGRDWAVGDLLNLSHLRENLAQPVVVVMCRSCANVQLFDAIAVGLVRQ